MKEAVESLLPIERNLFLSLNGSDSLFWDNVFWTITGKFVWLPLLLFLIMMFFYKRPLKEAILTVIAVALIIIICDQVSSTFFKAYFQRQRPSHHPDFREVVDIVKNYRSKGYGFISGHATNSFGIAVFLSLLYKSRWVAIPIITWALLYSYSRIYLGLHFISDIVAGMIVGTTLALIIYSIYTLIIKSYIKPGNPVENKPGNSPGGTKTIGMIIVGYLLLVIIFSHLLTTLPH